MADAKTSSTADVPCVSRGAATDTHWLPAPANLSVAEVEHFCALCDLVEENTGLAATDAPTIAAAVGAVREEAAVARFAAQAEAQGDLETWAQATKAANAAPGALRGDGRAQGHAAGSVGPDRQDGEGRARSGDLRRLERRAVDEEIEHATQ